MPKIEVSISSILDYIGDKKRPLKEGEAVFKAGHIIMCGVDVEQTNIIKSLCLQSSALGQPPHEIQIIPKENEMWNCECSCKAGMSGFCKHIIGTLIYINRNEDLEYLSCTELTQKWGKEKKGVEYLYTAKPFQEFCHPIIKRRKVTLQTNTSALNEKNFSILSVATGSSSIARFIGRTLEIPSKSGPHKNKCVVGVGNDRNETVHAGSSRKDSNTSENHSPFTRDRSTSTCIEKLIKNALDSKFLKNLSGNMNLNFQGLKPCCKAVLESLQKTDALKVAVYYPQGSEMWKKERQLRITGSTCYSIFTYGKDTWEKKAISFFFPKGFTNKVQHGIKYESEALKLFSEKNVEFEIIQTNLFVSQYFPWLGFSPDGIIFQNGKPWKLIEIKCPFIGKENGSEDFVKQCDYLIEDGTKNVKLKERHTYYGQIQLGMALLNLKETHFLVYSSFSKTYIEIMVKFDETFYDNLIRKISKRYFDNMLHFYCINKIE